MEVGFLVRTIFLLIFYFVKKKIRKRFLLFGKTSSTSLLTPLTFPCEGGYDYFCED